MQESPAGSAPMSLSCDMGFTLWTRAFGSVSPDRSFMNRIAGSRA